MTIEYENLLGIPWAYNTADCFSLCRAFYANNWGMDIPAIAHPLLWEATHPELDLIRTNIANCGFASVDVDPRTICVGDALLMQIGSGVRVINHCGVYVGGGCFIHQPFRAPSRKDLWAGEWRNATLIVVRHPQVPQEDSRPTLNVLDIIAPTKRQSYNGS